MRATVLAVIVFVVAAALASGVELSGDLARMLPDSDPGLARASEVLRRTLQRAVMDVEGDADAARVLARRLEEAGYSVRSGVAEAELLDVVDLYRSHAALLIDDYEALGQRMENVGETLRVLARRLQEPDGAHLAARAATDPLGITDLALAPLRSLGANLKGARILDGFVTSADGAHRLLFVDPGFAASETDRTERFLADLETASEGLAVRHLGTHRSTLDNARAIERDVALTAVVGLAAVLLLAWGIFRRPAVALLAVTPALFGAVVGMGVYALFRDAVAGAVAGFAAALLGIAIDYAVHVFSAKKTPVHAILMGATTTAGAFLVLNASSLPGLRESGTLGALGVVAAALFAILVLRPGQRAPRDLSPAVRVLQGRAMLVAVAVATPVILLGIKDLRFSGDVRELSRLAPDTVRDEDKILATWGDAFRLTTVLVEHKTLQGALERADEVGLTTLLPAKRTQEARWKRWRGFWSGKRLADLRLALRAGARGTPFNADAFDLRWIEKKPDPIEINDLPRDLVRDRIHQTPHGWIVNTPLPPGVSVPEVEGATVVNRAALVGKIAALAEAEVGKLGLLAFLEVGLLVALWLGRARPAAIVLLPLLLSCLWTFGLLGWLNIPLTLANAIFIVFLFGLAVDYAIFLAVARYERLRTGVDGVAESDAAVLLCAFTTCAGFGALLLAGHPVLHSIGATALIGIGAAALVMQAVVPRLVEKPATPDSVAALYRYQGPVVSRYASSKAKRDPIAAFLERLAMPGDILVAGCGYGVMTARLLLKQPGRKLLGVDSDPRKLEVAKNALRQFPNARFVRGDLREAALGTPKIVLLVDVLHYWPKDEQRAILQRLVDHLAPDGRLLFRDGCIDVEGHEWVARGEAWALRLGFTRAGRGLHFRTRADWRNLMHRCGLAVEREIEEAGAASNTVYLCRKKTS